MLKAHKVEYYPDGFAENGVPNGRKGFTLSVYTHNPKRVKEMSAQEKKDAADVIDGFIDRLKDYKNSVTK